MLSPSNATRNVAGRRGKKGERTSIYSTNDSKLPWRGVSCLPNSYASLRCAQSNDGDGPHALVTAGATSRSSDVFHISTEAEAGWQWQWQ